MTPLAGAASRGRSSVVKYLLEQGADPTLQGAPWEDNYSQTPQTCARGEVQGQEYLLERLKKKTTEADIPNFYQFEQYLPREHQTTLEKAKDLLLSYEHAKYTVRLLEVALKFWDRASYSSSHYKHRPYTNQPRNDVSSSQGILKDALQKVPEPTISCIERDQLEHEARLISETLDCFVEHHTRKSQEEKERRRRQTQMMRELQESCRMSLERNRQLQLQKKSAAAASATTPQVALSRGQQPNHHQCMTTPTTFFAKKIHNPYKQSTPKVAFAKKEHPDLAFRSTEKIGKNHTYTTPRSSAYEPAKRKQEGAPMKQVTVKDDPREILATCWCSLVGIQ